jgi:hypothetical protein
MVPESVLRTVILEDVTVAGLIDTRFYPVLPQHPTLPACTYYRVSHTVPDEIPFPTARIQVTCWAESRDDARALAEAVRLAGSGFKGDRHGMTVKYAKHENDLDLRDPQTGYHTVPVDFKVIYKEV